MSIQPTSEGATGGDPVLAGGLVLLAEQLRMMGIAASPDAVESVLDGLDELGIGAVVVARLRGADDPDIWARGVAALLDHVERSPAPAGEWPALTDLLSEDLLAELTGVSRASLHRYRSGARQTPDAVAARLHHVALVCADLAGSYTPVGIRRWFARPRTLLDGRSPRDVLAGAWDPDEPGPRAVADLARALVGFAL